MMRIIPKWCIQWNYLVEKDKFHTMFIHADNIMEATDWFNKINHGLQIISKVHIERDELTQEISGGFINELP